MLLLSRGLLNVPPESFTGKIFILTGMHFSSELFGLNFVIELSIEIQGAIFLFRICASHLLRELSYIYCFLKWFCSLKHQSYSRAYIDFKKPEDVIEFAEFFDGHLFVNEKGNLCAYLLKRFDYSNQSCCHKFCDYLFIHTMV